MPPRPDPPRGRRGRNGWSPTWSSGYGRPWSTGTVAPPPAADPASFGSCVAGSLPAVEITPDRVVVAAADRLGLLASVAGCLTLHRLDVVSADTATVVTLSGPMAVVACRVQPRDAAGPDRQRLAGDLQRALGRSSSARRGARGPPAQREPATQRNRPNGGAAGAARGGTAQALHHPEWSGRSTPPPTPTILELRAADDVGLLYRVAHALELAGANVRAARISTLGSDVVDAFYLVGDWTDPAARSTVERAVVDAASPVPP